MHAAISYATGTTPQELVPAIAGRRVRVLGLALVAAGAVTVTLKSAATSITGAMSLVTGVPLAAPPTSSMDVTPHLRTATGEALNLVLGGSVQVSGWIVYDYEVG